MAEDGDVGFEEGMMWLPSHVLNEACEPKEYLWHQEQQQQHHHHHHHQHRLKTPPEPFPRHSQRSGSKLHRRPRYPVNRASGGPGMQAVFLDSGQRSCGTGVFLPQRAGNNFQPSKKPACSSVLLPSRVVQALNLNVHALGSQRSPQRDISKNPKGGSGNLVSNNNDNDVNDRVSSQRCVTIISQSRSSSPEIFLPKEWTY